MRVIRSVLLRYMRTISQQSFALFYEKWCREHFSRSSEDDRLERERERSCIDRWDHRRTTLECTLMRGTIMKTVSDVSSGMLTPENVVNVLGIGSSKHRSCN